MRLFENDLLENKFRSLEKLVVCKINENKVTRSLEYETSLSDFQESMFTFYFPCK